MAPSVATEQASHGAHQFGGPAAAAPLVTPVATPVVAPTVTTPSSVSGLWQHETWGTNQYRGPDGQIRTTQTGAGNVQNADAARAFLSQVRAAAARYDDPAAARAAGYNVDSAFRNNNIKRPGGPSIHAVNHSLHEPLTHELMYSRSPDGTQLGRLSGVMVDVTGMGDLGFGTTHTHGDRVMLHVWLDGATADLDHAFNGKRGT